jgi:hypothetical protein
MTGIVGSTSLAVRPTSQPSSFPNRLMSVYDRPEIGCVILKKANCFLAGCSEDRTKAAVRKRVFDHCLNKLVVLDDQDPDLVCQSNFPHACPLRSSGRVRGTDIKSSTLGTDGGHFL